MKCEVGCKCKRHESRGRHIRPWRKRFAEKVEEGPIHPFRPELGNCLLWTAAIQLGYGVFSPNQSYKRQAKAHRWLYEQDVGPVPEGLELDHTCRRRHCVNVNHLEPVTKQENWARSREYRDLSNRTLEGRFK